MKEYILESIFEELDCREAFDNLTEKEQKYLHFYSKVSEFYIVQHIHEDFFIKFFRPAGMELLYHSSKHHRNRL